MMEHRLGAICPHCQLARQCEMCDRGREIAQLRAASLRLLDALDRLDHGSREPGFRGWENGNGEPCGDEVEDARQALAAVARMTTETIR